MGHGSRRDAMVARQLRDRGITDPDVLAAMATVPRHRFVDASQRSLAYVDRPLPIGGGQTISQPFVVARMVEALAPGPDDLVLDVGTGSGYAAAILAELARRVVGVEQDENLAQRARVALGDRDDIRIVQGDGRNGCPEEAPFDVVHVAAAAPKIPPALLRQLADGGRLVMPVGPRSSQHLVLVERRDGRYHETDLGRVRFVPLLGGDGADRDG